MESVEVTKEAVTGMSAPTFYYAEVRPIAPKIRSEEAFQFVLIIVGGK